MPSFAWSLLQELRNALDSKAAACAAAEARAAGLERRLEQASLGAAAAAQIGQHNAALRRELEEVTLSYHAAQQSKDRALSQVRRL